MRDEEIHIGDMVIVREWKDLEGEYGTVMYGNIPLFHKCTIFSTDMKWLCGKILIVAGRYMGIGGAYGYYFLEDVDDNFICSDMLDPCGRNGWALVTGEEKKRLLVAALGWR